MNKAYLKELFFGLLCVYLFPAVIATAQSADANSPAGLKLDRPWKVYLLPHSHVDIGYTEVQTAVEKKQWDYLEAAIELSKKTTDYPEGSRFKWNSEVLWAVKSYLKQASKEQRVSFIDAVKKGWIGLDGLYCNQLTALCRQEELVRLLDCARQLRSRYGVEIDSAMITDVPGYTWGIIPVLAQSGVKYFSIGPNASARIGFSRVWNDQPFYWVSPSGREKVLCWMAGKGYSWFHGERRINEERIFEYLRQLEDSEYPYDIVQVRYSIISDNGPPDPCLPEFVRQFNEKHDNPRSNNQHPITNVQHPSEESRIKKQVEA